MFIQDAFHSQVWMAGSSLRMKGRPQRSSVCFAPGGPLVWHSAADLQNSGHQMWPSLGRRKLFLSSEKRSVQQPFLTDTIEFFVVFFRRSFMLSLSTLQFVESGFNMFQCQSSRLYEVQSIPGYVERCDFFMVLAPELFHRDTGLICNSTSWQSRGWYG